MPKMFSSLPMFAAFAALSLSCTPPDDDVPLAEGEIEHDDDIGKTDTTTRDSLCPTAPENRPLSHFWWKTSRYPERYVWTPDGTRLLGAEILYEEKKSWDPLAGTTRKRKTCHRLFFVNLDGSGRQDLGAAAPLQAGELFAFPSLGYALVQLYREGAYDFVRVGVDGARTTVATAEGSCVWGRALPAPDGTVIAFVRTTQPGCEEGGGGVGSTTEVRFFDASGAPRPTSATLAMPGFAEATWTPAGELIVSDGASARRVGLDGVVADAPVPGCIEPPTASSEVDATGQVLGVDADGSPAIVATEPGRAFGCQ